MSVPSEWEMHATLRICTKFLAALLYKPSLREDRRMFLGGNFPSLILSIVVLFGLSRLFYIQEDETVEADSAVTKAGTVVESIPNPESHVALILRYKSTYARVLDANRKFLQAAQRYHDLSQTATDMIDADDVLNMLGRAATCAILAPSGPQRQRVLGHVSAFGFVLQFVCGQQAHPVFSIGSCTL